jgi:hypothetical protein
MTSIGALGGWGLASLGVVQDGWGIALVAGLAAVAGMGLGALGHQLAGDTPTIATGNAGR